MTISIEQLLNSNNSDLKLELIAGSNGLNSPFKKAFDLLHNYLVERIATQINLHGIINVKDLLGAAAVRASKYIAIIVKITEWLSNAYYDRTEIEDKTVELLEVIIPHTALPIRPGRNIPSIVEVAACNHLLKHRDITTRDFQKMLENNLLMVIRQ